MKKLIVGCFVLATIAACGGGGSKEKEKTGKTETTGDLGSNPDYQKGLQLVADNRCMNCHGVDNAITGPAYMEVAERYAGRPDTIISHLARKIINGGTGEWGEMPMAPNSSVSQADAEAMVKYILLLKK
jgi:cytochrome c